MKSQCRIHSLLLIDFAALSFAIGLLWMDHLQYDQHGRRLYKSGDSTPIILSPIQVEWVMSVYQLNEQGGWSVLVEKLLLESVEESNPPAFIVAFMKRFPSFWNISPWYPRGYLIVGARLTSEEIRLLSAAKRNGRRTTMFKLRLDEYENDPRLNPHNEKFQR